MQEILRGFAKLARFSGRDTQRQFWIYAIVPIVAAFIGSYVVMIPMIAGSLADMQQFALEHPEQATVRSTPTSYSIEIEGYHPELMPDFSGVIPGMAIVLVGVIGLLAAAVTRRLHDRNRRGYWGLIPLPFLATGLFGMQKVFASFATSEPDLRWFFLIFFNNMAYIGSIVLLVVWLARSGTPGANRYGPDPKAP